MTKATQPATQLHATAVAAPAAAALSTGNPPLPDGVLLCGPSGSGKSDLALRLIDAGWSLVGDDRVDIVTPNDPPSRVIASPPSILAGKIEVRGLGIIHLPYMPLCRVRLMVNLVSPKTELDRIPDAVFTDLSGVRVPVLQLCGLHASAPVTLGHAMAMVLAGGSVVGSHN